jgi:hypothetical protein
MDFGKVLGRAWEITWRWKMLWVLGFLASLGQGGGVSQSSYSLTGEEFNNFGWSPYVPLDEFFARVDALRAIVAIIIGVACLVFIIVIVLWVISVIARGGLIAAVQQIEDEEKTSFSSAWSAGVKKFWTLFGLGVLTSLPMLILVFIGMAVGITLFLVSIGVNEGSDLAVFNSILFMVLCGGLFCCGVFFLTIILEQIRIYGERAAILEDAGWIDAFKRGWQVLVENLGATIILWLIFFAIGIVIFGISFVIAIAVAAPLLGIFFVSEPGYWWFAPICLGGLLGVVIFALIRSILTAFTSATWTLAFREMTGEPDVDLIPVGEAEV